jgi:Putative heavy-metal-binding
VYCLVLRSCVRTEQAPPPSAPPVPAAPPVLLIRGTLPQAVHYRLLGPITVRTPGPGERAWALGRLADEARKRGANAVIEVVTQGASLGRDETMPTATGVAIQIVAPSVEEVAQWVGGKGEWH